MAETQQKAHEADNGQVPLEFDEEATEVEISSEVSPLADKPVKKLKIDSSFMFPIIISRKIFLLSSKLRFFPLDMFLINSSILFI